jgi:hypothetical protein
LLGGNLEHHLNRKLMEGVIGHAVIPSCLKTALHLGYDFFFGHGELLIHFLFKVLRIDDVQVRHWKHFKTVLSAFSPSELLAEIFNDGFSACLAFKHANNVRRYATLDAAHVHNYPWHFNFPSALTVDLPTQNFMALYAVVELLVVYDFTTETGAVLFEVADTSNKSNRN